MAQPYYNVGTVALTAGSTAMVGTGTLWSANVRVGDTVQVSGGQNNIVAVVTDNTHITLLFPAEATVTGKAYAILYTPDDPFTQQLARSVLQQISGSALVALGGLTPAARKGVRFDGSGAASLIDISDFALTLLDDTSASGALATLLSSGIINNQLKLGDPASDATAQNGIVLGKRSTGYSEVIQASKGSAGGNRGSVGWRNDDAFYIRAGDDVTDDFIVTSTGSQQRDAGGTLRTVFHQGNLLGTVSQSSGVPSGSVIEQGTNANGVYTRFADGTQICRARVPFTSVAMTVSFAGGLYRPASALTWNFPAPFAGGYFCVTGNVYEGTLSGLIAITNGSYTQGRFFPVRAASGTADITVEAMAIGEWF